MQLWLTFALLVLAALWLVSHAKAGTTDQECLAGLLGSVSNEGLLASNWSGPNFPCAAPFVGISCDPNSQQVCKLQLSGFGIVGQLPSELAMCASLSELDLSRNILSGSIPAALGTLYNLSSLNLSDNSLQGSIPPELGSCTLLERLDLEDNQLTGSIPNELASLDKLSSLSLGDNDLSGPIPSGLARRPGGGARFTSSSFRPGNMELSGYPLSLPPARSITVVGIVFIGLASGLVSLSISFAAVCAWMKYTDAQKFKCLPE